MHRPVILITRPAEDALELAHKLEERGFATLCEPMLNLHPTPQQATAQLAQIVAHKPQAVIVTSRHALPPLAPHPQLHERKLFAAGAVTARAAGHHGFQHIAHAPDAHTLLRQVLSACSAGDGPLLYARGEDVSYDIASALRHQGFTVDEAMAYRMCASEALSPALRTALGDNTLYAATFLSVRTAEVFLRLMAETPHLPVLAHIRAVAFSPTIARTLEAATWRGISVCEHPSMACLLAEVDKLAAQS